jgi:hypothetical protein
MSRFHGRWSLGAAILCAGLVHAEPAKSAKKPAESDKVLTITNGSKTHKCEVLRSYKHPSGGIAYEVKVEDTGEVMTVIEDEETAKEASAAPAAKPSKLDATMRPSTPDPIMQPKQYIGSPRVRQQLYGDAAKSDAEAKYGKAPTPAMKRWFRQKPEVQKVEAVAVAQPMEAVLHADPVIRLIGSLRDEVMPSMREVAAMSLAQSTARSRPEVLAALAEAAERDPAPSVRECCARCLTEMGVR